MGANAVPSAELVRRWQINLKEKGNPGVTRFRGSLVKENTEGEARSLAEKHRASKKPRFDIGWDAEGSGSGCVRSVLDKKRKEKNRWGGTDRHRRKKKKNLKSVT